MAKIELDKYYTPNDVVMQCINIIEEEIDMSDIKYIIEPSAGGGAFSNVLYARYRDKHIEAYDIAPEEGVKGVVQADFLTADIPRRFATLVVGNPPFGGVGSSLMQQFIMQSVLISDYVAFILPITQYNNLSILSTIKDCRLIKSVELGDVLYSGTHRVPSCFNIYKKEVGYSVPSYNSNKIKILSYSRGETKLKREDYDVCMCAWGNVGKQGKHDDWVLTMLIYVDLEGKEKEEVIDYIKGYNWGSKVQMRGSLSHYKVHSVLALKFPQYYV